MGKPGPYLLNVTGKIWRVG